MSSTSLTTVTSLSNYSSSSYSEHSNNCSTDPTNQPLSRNRLGIGRTDASDITGNSNYSSTNMGQVDKSSLACKSLSWDSYPLNDLTNTGTEVTFTEIEKFLRDDTTFAEACGSQHSRLEQVENRPVLSSTPNQQTMNKILLNRSDLVNISSLLLALPDFGLTPTESQLKLLRSKIPIQEESCVRFGDFVDCVKDVFHNQLSERCHNSSNISNTRNSPVASTAICQNCTNSKNHMSGLEIRVQHLENRLSQAQHFCSSAERKLLISGMELQVQIERTRKLTEQLEFETKAINQEKADFELRLQVAEEKLKCGADSLPLERTSTDQSISETVDHLTSEIRQLDSTNLTYKDTIAKMLDFLEGLCDTLKHPNQTANAKVGRSFSLYRNATVTNAGQAAIPRGAVLRAASVCTAARPSSTRSSSVSSIDKGLDSTKVNVQNRYASLILQSEALIASAKVVLQGNCGSQIVDEDAGNSLRRKCSITNKPLQNLPESTVVTVMSKV